MTTESYLDDYSDGYMRCLGEDGLVHHADRTSSATVMMDCCGGTSTCACLLNRAPGVIDEAVRRARGQDVSCLRCIILAARAR